jgi:MinD-like ATPase involved in chromosome partitioning or flagellar assembly
MTIDQQSRPTEADVPFAPRSAFAGASRAEQYIEVEDTAAAEPSFAETAPVMDEPAAAAPLATEETPGVPVAVARSSVPDIGLVGLAAPAPKASSGIRGLVGKLGITVAPSKAEAAKLEAAELQRLDEEVIRQTTWTRAVSILIANPKGGVGKTPTALALGGVLAATRGGSVCILEVSDDPGALTFRAEGNPKLGLGELVRDVETIRSAGQLAGYTAPQTSFASVIGTVGRRQRLSKDDVVEVARVIDEFYNIRVMDSGNQPSSSAFAGAVATADALVVPIYNTGDAVIEALSLLDELRATGGHAAALADAAILLRLTDGRPENLAVVERVEAMIGDAGFAQQFVIPFDPHIAERSQISLARLTQPTVRAFTAAAAGVIRSLQSTVR